MRGARPDFRQAAAPLEATYSLAEVREHLGIGETALHELLYLGKRCKGVHPLKGGLFPTFKLSHKKRRVPASAIERHKAHMLRLEIDDQFRAEMKAKARGLALNPYGRRSKEEVSAA